MKKRFTISILIIGVFITLSDLHSGTVPVDKTVVNHLGDMFLRNLVRARIDGRVTMVVAEGFRDIMLGGAGYLSASFLIDTPEKIIVSPAENISIGALNGTLNEIFFGAGYELFLRKEVNTIPLVKLKKLFKGALARFSHGISTIDDEKLKSRLCASVVVATTSLPFALLKLRPLEDPRLWSISALRAFYVTFEELFGVFEEYGYLKSAAAEVFKYDSVFRDKFLSVIRAVYRISRFAAANLGGNLAEHRDDIELLLTKIAGVNRLFAPAFLMDKAGIDRIKSVNGIPLIPDIFTVFPGCKIVTQKSKGQSVLLFDRLRDPKPIKITVSEMKGLNVQLELVLPKGYKIENFGNPVFRAKNSKGENALFVICRLQNKFYIKGVGDDSVEIGVKYLRRVTSSQVKLVIFAPQSYVFLKDENDPAPRPIFNEFGEFTYYGRGK